MYLEPVRSCLQPNWFFVVFINIICSFSQFRDEFVIFAD